MSEDSKKSSDLVPAFGKSRASFSGTLSALSVI